jgi:molybdopterin converting factor small subunit
LIEVLGKREFALFFSGENIGDLLQALLAQYGPPLSRLLAASQGQMNKAVQFILNGRLSVREYQNFILKEGDRVALVVQLEGG